MISALSSSASGMLANQRALDISANNTANANTDGFQPARANFSQQAGGGVEVNPSTRVTLSSQASAASAGKTAPSGTDLANEAVNAMTYKIGFEASAKMVKTADQMLGSLIDTKA